MLKLNLMILSLTFLFSGCSQKEVVIKKELMCVEQLTIPKPEVSIRIHKDDNDLAKAFKDANDMGYKFYEKQVKRNNKLCISKVRKDDNNDNKEVKKR